MFRFTLLNKNTYLFVLLGVVVVIGASAYFFYVQKKIATLSLELEQQHIQETVFVGNVAYRVDGGSVLIGSSTVLGFKALQPLLLARATTIARRADSFALPNTDPLLLREAIKSLEGAQKKLSSLQKNSEDAKAVLSLYPIRFLLALADAEASRQAFLRHPDVQTQRAYEYSVAKTFSAKEKDLEDFTREFGLLMGTSSKRFIGLSGSATTERMRQALAVFKQDTSVSRDLFYRRTNCGWFSLRDCEKIPSTAVPSIPSSSATTTLQSQDQEVLAFWAQVDKENNQDAPVVMISESNCLASLAAPYSFVFSEVKNKFGVFTSINYVGNIFFIPTNQSNAPFLEYEKEILGVDYSLFNPFKYYTCSEIGEDIGRIYAIKAIADFAVLHPTVAPQYRGLFLTAPFRIDEKAALTYLSEALIETKKDSALTHELIELSRMYELKTGGLLELVKDMALVSMVDVQLKEKGAPIDISAQSLFATHSAFPSLFRIGSENTSALPRTTMFVVEDIRRFFEGLENYRTLSTEVSQEKIINDVRSFLEMEQRI